MARTQYGRVYLMNFTVFIKIFLWLKIDLEDFLSVDRSLGRSVCRSDGRLVGRAVVR